MHTPQTSINELNRLEALKSYHILHSAPDPSFDRLAKLASLVCETPVAFISLITDEEQWFKARVGLEVESVPRSVSICQHTIDPPQYLEIEDTRLDSRFNQKELITGDANVIFYAGYPLQDARGYALGTFCVLDFKPRHLTDTQRITLQTLAEQAMELIRSQRDQEELRYIEKLFLLSSDLVCVAGTDGFFKRVNPSFEKILGWDETFLLSNSFFDLVHPDDRFITEQEIAKLADGQPTINFTHRFRMVTGGYKILQWVATPETSTGYLFAIARDITLERNIQEAIHVSENKFRSFFENAQGLMCTHDLQGNFLSINKNGAAIFGFTVDEMLKMGLYDIVPPKYHDHLHGYLNSIATTGNASGLMTTRSKDGRLRVLLFNNNRELNSDGSWYVIGNSIDITDRLSLEKDLKQTRELLEQTNRLAKVGAWEFQVEKEKLIWSSVTKLIHEVPDNYTPAVDEAILFYEEGESRDKIQEAVRRGIESGESWDVELQIRTAKGNLRWVRSQGNAEMQKGKCIRIFGAFQDITDQKATKLALEASEFKYRAFFENSPVAIAINRHQDGRFVDGNKALFTMIGYTEAEYRSLSHWDVTPEKYDDQEVFHRQSLEERGYYGPYEKEYRHKNGKLIPVLLHGVRFTADNGEQHVYSVIQDISARKEMELALENAKQQAEQASLAKSEFLASMSHEIRTPLNGVIGFTDLILKTRLDETQKQYLSIVNQSGNTLLSIINDILDFSKIEAGKLELETEKCDLYEITSQAADIISYPIKTKKLEMLLNISTELPRFIYADPVRLKQVLINLLSNAAKFTEQGEIELKAEALQSLTDDEMLIRFEVRDTGIGIRADKQEKIFQAFSQEDGTVTRKYGGTGLGLTISNKLLALMGSNLQLKSSPGEGSTFFFDLKVKTEKGAQDRWENTGNIRKVLIVDDNENNRTILSQMLLLEQIHADIARSGIEALQILGTGKKYDVILMDYHMPVMDGVETIRKIRQNYSATTAQQPIMLLSSSSDEESVIRACEELDVYIRLVKPIKMQELYRSLSRLHRASQQTDQPGRSGENRVSFGKIRVLIAEDGEVNMLLATTIVKKIAPEAEIISAVNGKLAVEACKNALPDLILMDIQMPEMNGHEATGHIRRLPGAAQIPVIAITAGTVKGEREKCMEAGMNDFVAKPVVEEALLKIFRKWLNADMGSQEEEKTAVVLDNKKHIDFAKLNQYVNNDPAAFQGFLLVIQTELEKSMKDIEKHAGKKDVTALKKAGHKLKGTTLSAGLEYLTEYALSLDQLSVFDETAVPQLITAARNEMAIIHEEIRKQLLKTA
jgi:PAS domain S-box-containing protein